MAQNNTKVFVERETFETKGKKYWSYFIKGTIRGKEVKICIVPPDKDVDKGGYLVFDIIFGNADKAEVVLKPYEIKDETTGKVITGNSYAIRAADEDGEIYECTFKPFRASDKALLGMLLK